MEQSRDLLAAIVESSDDAIVGQDMDGRIVSWNRGAERIYGYPAEEARGKPLSFKIDTTANNPLREQTITVKNGGATLADGTIAGSVATFDANLRRVVQELGVPLAPALVMASLGATSTAACNGSRHWSRS